MAADHGTGSVRQATGTPRSLADDLRARPDAELVALLRERPDLAVPQPAKFATVATRAGGRGSAQRALDRLDLPTLQVLEVMAVHDDSAVSVSAGTISARWGADARVPIARLRSLALVWG